jgi:hypothetical protein
MRAEKTYRSRLARWAVAAVAVLAGAAAQAQTGAEEKDGEELGVATPCLNQPTIRRTRIINDRNIAFFTRDGKIYHNELLRECPSLRPRSVVNYSIANGRICQGTQFQVMWEASTSNFIPAFVCTLGAFVPITLAQLEDLEALTATEPRPNRRRRAREPVTTQEVELPP